MRNLILCVVIVSCFAVGGCAELRLRSAALVSDPAPAVPTDQQPDHRYLAEEASYYAEYAPWRAQRHRSVPSHWSSTNGAPLLRAGIDPAETSSAPQPELPPSDPDELARWLEQRRERAKQAHEVQMAWLNELDREAEKAIQSICTGC
jgi:hypothetical protein